MKEVIGVECKFAVHIPAELPTDKDLHFIKERIHYSDGTTEPNTRIIENFKRTFYTTKRAHRKHKDKKEHESIDKLDKHITTQTEMRNNVLRALDRTWSNDQMRDLSNSPFLYGSDISSTSIIKYMYKKKYPNIESFNSIASLDIETDMIHNRDEIIMTSLTMFPYVYLYVREDFCNRIHDYENKVINTANRLLAKYVESHQLKFEVFIVKTEIECISAPINQAHIWKPDFLEIWNIDFELTRFEEASRRANVDLKDIFSDPSVPKDRRFYKYKRGRDKQVTASGKVKPMNPSSKWHWAFYPASFAMIDGMCAYRHIRAGGQEESSYGLDALMKKHGLDGKLSIEETDKYDGEKWHCVMQTDYKVEYGVYCMLDTIGPLLLDEVTKDLASTFTTYAGITDFCNFKSQPKRNVDDYHFFLLENENCVIGSTPTRQFTDNKDDVDLDEIADDDDEDENEDAPVYKEAAVLSLRDWIDNCLTVPVLRN